jgi:DNA repair ATPase RecN
MMPCSQSPHIILLYEAVQHEAKKVTAKLEGNEFPALEGLMEALKAFCDVMHYESSATIAAYQPDMEALAQQIQEWREIVQTRSNHLRKALANIPSRHKALSAYTRRKSSRMASSKRYFYGGL